MEFHDDYNSVLYGKYYLAGSRLGAPTSPMTPKQLEEFGKRLNEGIINVEIGTLKPDIFETIPEEHFKEIKRLAKISNANISMHAPLVEPSGFEEEAWSEQKRVINEKQIGNILERAGDLGENIPVVLHGANVFGQQWEEGLKTQKGEEALRAMRVVNEETGQTRVLPYEKKEKLLTKREREAEGLKPGEKEIIFDPMRRLDSLNKTEWDKEVLELFNFQKDMDEVNEKIEKKSMENLALQKANLLQLQDERARFARNTRDINIMQGHTHELDINLRSHFDELYSRAKKYSKGEEKENNIKILENIRENYEKIGENTENLLKEANQKLRNELRNVRSEKEMEKIKVKIQEEFIEKKRELDEQRSKFLLSGLKGIEYPEVWKPVKDFAIEKASETIAGAALHAFDKFGEKAPVIAVENSYPEMPLARADELKKGIELARKKFADKLVKEKNLSREESRELANKLIGATWDIGHINLLRRAGYSEEDLKKLVIEETKKIAPLVKHVHITDNFGFNDTHLPPGMGNVPVKEMLEELEKRGWAGRGIIEAGNFVKEFEISPFQHVLSYFTGAPQDVYGSYFETFIQYPEKHFDFYGSGFSTLPRELGGQMPTGEKGRFMEGGEREAS